VYFSDQRSPLPESSHTLPKGKESAYGSATKPGRQYSGRGKSLGSPTAPRFLRTPTGRTACRDCGTRTSCHGRTALRLETDTDRPKGANECSLVFRRRGHLCSNVCGRGHSRRLSNGISASKEDPDPSEGLSHEASRQNCHRVQVWSPTRCSSTARSRVRKWV